MLVVFLSVCQAEEDALSRARERAAAAKYEAQQKLDAAALVVKLCSICSNEECRGFIEDPFAAGMLFRLLL